MTTTTRLTWHGANPSQRARWSRRLSSWLRASHLWPAAEREAQPWLARHDGPAAYAAAYVASQDDLREQASTTDEIPEPLIWTAGDETGTWGPTTQQPGLLRCGDGEWPIPTEHAKSRVLREAWGRIAADERDQWGQRMADLIMESLAISS